MKIKNEFRLKFLSLYEDLSKKSIPEELKHMSSIIQEDLIENENNSFNKYYEFGSYQFNVIVDYKKGNKQAYYSNINIDKIFQNPEEIVDIVVKVIDNEIDITYLLSVIIHEIRHIYDLYNIIYEYDVKDFHKELDIQKFKGTDYFNFTNLIYLSLEHELIARHNMLYTMFRWSKITDKNELLKLYKKLFVYESLVQLKNFNSINFVNNFNENDLLDFTNFFIKDVARETNFCKNKYDLIDFYKKWEEFFIKKSIEFLNYVDSMFDEIISDITNNKTYEKINYSYNEYCISEQKKYLKSSMTNYFYEVVIFFHHLISILYYHTHF